MKIPRIINGHEQAPYFAALSFRVDVINVPNRTTFATPNLTPTSTELGRIITATASTPRFVQFVTRLNF